MRKNNTAQRPASFWDPETFEAACRETTMAETAMGAARPPVNATVKRAFDAVRRSVVARCQPPKPS